MLPGVDKQAFSETPGAGQEIVLPMVDKLGDQRGFVHVAIVVFYNIGTGWLTCLKEKKR